MASLRVRSRVRSSRPRPVSSDARSAVSADFAVSSCKCCKVRLASRSNSSFHAASFCRKCSSIASLINGSSSDGRYPGGTVEVISIQTHKSEQIIGLVLSGAQVVACVSEFQFQRIWPSFASSTAARSSISSRISVNRGLVNVVEADKRDLPTPPTNLFHPPCN